LRLFDRVLEDDRLLRGLVLPVERAIMAVE
jgi:hypothetical protein